jgi:hypothetical protein
VAYWLEQAVGGVYTATQQTPFVPLCCCNNITLKWQQLRQKHVGEKSVIEIHHKYCSAFLVVIFYENNSYFLLTSLDIRSTYKCQAIGEE